MIPKLSNTIPKTYTISKSVRDSLRIESYLLTSSINDYTNVEKQVTLVPLQEMIHLDHQTLYNKITEHLYTLSKHGEGEIEPLPNDALDYLQRVYAYWKEKKTTKNFKQKYDQYISTNQTALNDLKIQQSRKRTAQTAQLLSSDYTRYHIESLREDLMPPAAHNNLNTGSSSGTQSVDETSSEPTTTASEATTPTASETLATAPTASETLATAPTASETLATIPTASETLATASTASTASGTLPTIPTIPTIPTRTTRTTRTTTKDKSWIYTSKKQKSYTVEKPPSDLIGPHKPKIQHSEGEKIKIVCKLGIEAVSTRIGYKDSQEVKEYLDHLEDQNKNVSLSKFEGILKFLEDALETDPESIPHFIWNHSIHSTANPNIKIMADIISFTLTDFAANIRYSTPPNNNHERTPFVEFIVPMFKYFSKVTKLLHFGWCEKFSKSVKYARIELPDYEIEVAPSRFADGLGYTQITGNEEVFMESSSGIEDEEVTHTLEDTAKLILLCTNSLTYIINKNQQARFETFIDKSSFGIQIIKDTVTLTKTSVLRNELKWKVIELRSSQYPVSWDTRYKWIKMFELIATLFIELKKSKEIDINMEKEAAGLGGPGETVREHFSRFSSAGNLDPTNNNE